MAILGFIFAIQILFSLCLSPISSLEFAPPLFYFGTAASQRQPQEPMRWVLMSASSSTPTVRPSDTINSTTWDLLSKHYVSDYIYT